MALSFVVENGSGLSNATSYAATTEADSYFERIPALYATKQTWDSLTTQQKEAALVHATDTITQEIYFNGYKKKSTQRLAFPRYSLYDKEGFLVDSDIVPELIKFATSELAAILAATDRQSDNATKGITEIKVDVIGLKFDKTDRTETIPDNVYTMLSQYASNANSAIVSHIRRY